MTETVGIIDLGSNSVRLAVVRLTAGAFRVIAEAKAVVRLAAELDRNGVIGQAGLARALAALGDFKRMGRSHAVDLYLAVATAAVRQAADGAEFIQAISSATGIQFQVVSEAEESELSFLGALNTLDISDGVLMDVGGASTELVRFAGRRVTAYTSLPYGAVTLTARFLPGGEGSPEAYAALTGFLSQLLTAVPWLHSGRALPLIGVGGTVRNLARVDRKTHHYPLELLHNYRMTPAVVEATYHLLRGTPVPERTKLPGLSADRADIIVGGAAMVSQAIAGTGARELVVSGAGLREGLLYRHLLREDGSSLVSDVLAHSIANLIHSFGLDEAMARATSRLGLLLFDRLQRLHGLEPWARRCLSAAAALVELGNCINIYGQEAHTFYLLTRGRLYGLTHREMLIAGAAAGYKSAGKARALLAPFAGMLAEGDDEAARRLGVIVGLAREMTRYEPHAVRDLRVQILKGEVVLGLSAESVITAELRGLQGIAPDFRKAFGARLLVQHSVAT